MSSSFALLAALDMAEVAAFDPLEGVALCPAPALANDPRTTSTTRTRTIRFFFMVFSPVKRSISFCGLAAFFTPSLGHAFAVLGLALPAAAVVINAAVEVHPALAAGIGRRNAGGVLDGDLAFLDCGLADGLGTRFKSHHRR